MLRSAIKRPLRLDYTQNRAALLRRMELLVMRITPKQLEFLLTLHGTNEGRESYWECFRHERRTALALHKKGMIEFEGGEEPEKDDAYFMARMTEKGWAWFNA